MPTPQMIEPLDPRDLGVSRMLDASFLPRWLSRHHFDDKGQGTLTPAAAAELVDRHDPPLATTPKNVDKDYMPREPVNLVLSSSGHVFDGQADLAAVVARGVPVRAIVTLAV